MMCYISVQTNISGLAEMIRRIAGLVNEGSYQVNSRTSCSTLCDSADQTRRGRLCGAIPAGRSQCGFAGKVAVKLRVDGLHEFERGDDYLGFLAILTNIDGFAYIMQ